MNSKIIAAALLVSASAVQVEQKGVPVLVNPVIARATGAEGEKLGLKLLVGPDEVSVAKKQPKATVLAQTSNPVWNPPFNNWSVNQPSGPHAQGLAGKEDLGLRNLVIEGVNGYDLVQTEAQNPVWNPPFNNWSVNQPSPPHAHGLSGTADLGQNIIVDGHAIHFNQVSEPSKLVQLNDLDEEHNVPGDFLVQDKDFDRTALYIMTKDIDNEPGHFVIVDEDYNQSIE